MNRFIIIIFSIFFMFCPTNALSENIYLIFSSLQSGYKYEFRMKTSFSEDGLYSALREYINQYEKENGTNLEKIIIYIYYDNANKEFSFSACEKIENNNSPVRYV